MINRLSNLFWSSPAPVPVDNDDEGTDCTVCLTTVESSASDRIETACKHVFHQECLKKWLKKKNDCPNCRKLNPAPSLQPPNPNIRVKSLEGCPFAVKAMAFTVIAIGVIAITSLGCGLYNGVQVDACIEACEARLTFNPFQFVGLGDSCLDQCTTPFGNVSRGEKIQAYRVVKELKPIWQALRPWAW